MVQLSIRDQLWLEKALRKFGATVSAVHSEFNSTRRAGQAPVSRSTVQRFAAGKTHRRGSVEKRGRKRVLKAVHVRQLQQARVRLVRRVDNEERITYADVQKEAGLEGPVVSLAAGGWVGGGGKRDGCLAAMPSFALAHVRRDRSRIPQGNVVHVSSELAPVMSADVYDLSMGQSCASPAHWSGPSPSHTVATGVACQRTVRDRLHQAGVCWRPPREKIYLSEVDVKKRLRMAQEWVRYPKSFWSKKVHAYVDNKTFPLPLTPAQKKRYKQTRVTGHLRTRGEGVKRGFTKPRTRHTFLGVPSVTITAAVAGDRVILWQPLERGQRWNGGAAARMYKGPLLGALRRMWGPRRRFIIVEDGDRKGNQSGPGKTAKEEAGITAMTLPPRTPAWMPLDYAIWQEIEKRMVASDPGRHETKSEFILRLRRAAMSLPRGFVRKVIARMRSNIQGVIAAKGFHSKTD